MSKPHPIAILCSDLHLQEKAPVARSAEPDWWAAMLRPVKEMSALARKLKVPVVCAGDVFDHWKAPPEVINWALEHLPDGMYCVPGQHDLPLHNYEDVNKSAYGTLVRVGKITPLLYGKPTLINGAWFYGFPWNHPIKPTTPSKDDKLQVAVVHAYCWQKNATYPGAKDEQRVGAHKQKLVGYNVAVFGDNHIPFLNTSGDCTVFNHGGFMRRKSNEVTHTPALGILMSDGTVELHHTDISKDLFIDSEVAKFEEGDEFGMQAFLKELSSLGSSELDFKDAVTHYLKTYEVSRGAQTIILKALHNEQHRS